MGEVLTIVLYILCISQLWVLHIMHIQHFQIPRLELDFKHKTFNIDTMFKVVNN